MPKLVLEHQQKAIFKLVPIPWHGAQISARAPTKGYIQTGTHARARYQISARATTKGYIQTGTHALARCPN